MNSYVNRDFMTAIEHRQMDGFVKYALIYILVFAISTGVAVLYRYFEESLGLLWRKWLTGHAVERYLDDRTYFRLYNTGELSNPDQRISEDIRALTATTLSFALMFLNASFTVLAFSGVLWSISPLLFAVAVAYSLLGSLLAIFLGKPLVKLNYDQLDKEANFRSNLLRVRENAESIALLRREGRLKARLQRRLDELTANFQRIVQVNRNLGFFTTGYNFLIQIIPALIVAPLFIRGEAQFGEITQSAVAFGHLLGAFSLIITQFQSISTYTAVVARLNALQDAFKQKRPERSPTVDVNEACGSVAYSAPHPLRTPQRARPGAGPEPLHTDRGVSAGARRQRVGRKGPVPGYGGPLGRRGGSHTAPGPRRDLLPAGAPLSPARNPARGPAAHRRGGQGPGRADCRDTQVLEP